MGLKQLQQILKEKWGVEKKYISTNLQKYPLKNQITNKNPNTWAMDM